MSARLVFLGTGTSEGVPRVSCLTAPEPEKKCPVCWSARHVAGSRNRRRNTGAVIEFDAKEGGRPRAVAVDCGKMWWESAIQTFPTAGLRCLDAVLLTHWHNDAMYGLDDLRDLTGNITEHEGLTVYCNEVTLEHVQKAFDYLVKSPEEVKALKQQGGGVAEMAFSTFSDGTSFEVVPGLVCTPFNVQHGGCKEMSVFRIGSLAYVSDVSNFPPESRRFLRGARHIVLDALRPAKPHPSHFTLDNALTEIKTGFGVDVVPEQVWLVGMNHELDHDATNQKLQEQDLPFSIACAYDGLEITFQIYNHDSEIAEM